MSGPMGTMHIAASGLKAMQRAVNAAANNITNAETEGYSRRRVDLVTNIPQYLPGLGEVNTGVRIDGVSRVRDGFLDRQVRIEQGNTAYYETRQEALDQVEMILREPTDTGLSAAMGEMWDAWQELSKSPESSTAKTVVIEKTIAVTDMFNHMDKQLRDVEDNTLSGVHKDVYDVNTLVEQIRDVDEQIVKTQLKGIVPNDLLDHRDLLLDKLSRHVDIKSSIEPTGSLKLLVSNVQVTGIDRQDQVLSSIEEVVDDGSGSYILTLVQEGKEGESPKTLTLENVDPAEVSQLKKGGLLFHKKISGPSSSIDLSLDSATHIVQPVTGRIQGLRDMLSEVRSYGEDLDEMASSMAKIVNQVHRDGRTVDEANGWRNLFTAGGLDPETNQVSAENIQVNSDLVANVSYINVGKGDGTTSSSAPGDGTRALAIASLQTFRYDVKAPVFTDPGDGTAYINYEANDMSLTYTGAGGTTVGKYYDNLVGRLGVSAQQANRMVDNQEALLSQIEQRRESVSGVSIDEEITDLIRFQRGYQANARVMSTLSEMLDILINLGR